MYVSCVQMCFEWFTKGQHDLESDVQQQLFKEKILKLEPYEITMNGQTRRKDICCCSPNFRNSNILFLSGFNLFKTFFENVNLCDHRLKRQGTQLVSRMFICTLILHSQHYTSISRLCVAIKQIFDLIFCSVMFLPPVCGTP